MSIPAAVTTVSYGNEHALVVHGDEMVVVALFNDSAEQRPTIYEPQHL
jgi:hypothetical protein